MRSLSLTMNWMVGDIGEKREGVAVAGGGDRGG
jgi:hypothetical protein